MLNMGPLWQFGQAKRSVPAYGWASDSSGIWTATREKIGPGGINGSGLQPAFISLKDGSIRLFEPPRHKAGPLDGLLWGDGDGLALAYFGARGQSYQPQRHDKHPTFAMIDAKRGVILDTVFEGLKDAYYIANVNNAAVTRLQNGKLRALVSALDQWVVWTQGEPPRILPNPYPDPQESNKKIAISRDGSRLLVARLRCDAGTVDETRARRLWISEHYEPPASRSKASSRPSMISTRAASFGTFARPSLGSIFIQIRQSARMDAMRSSDFPSMVPMRSCKLP